MVYRNYFTTPSGKFCFIREMKNRDYLVLVKYLESEDYRNFFSNIDNFILEDIPDFSEFSVFDKAYTYLVICYYYIRPKFTMNTDYGPKNIGIDVIIENMDNCVPGNMVCKIGSFDFEFGLPKSFYFEEQDKFMYDYISGLVKVNGKEITEKERKEVYSLPTQFLVKIEEEGRKHFNHEINIFEGNSVANEITLNVYSPALIYVIISIFKDSLENFYQKLYYSVHYMKMTYDGYMDITPFEFDVIFEIFKKDKEKQNESSNGKGSYDPDIADQLMGI